MFQLMKTLATRVGACIIVGALATAAELWQCDEAEGCYYRADGQGEPVLAPYESIIDLEAAHTTYGGGWVRVPDEG